MWCDLNYCAIKLNRLLLHQFLNRLNQCVRCESKHIVAHNCRVKS